MIRFGKQLGIDRIQIMTLVPYVETQKYKNLHYHRTLANTYFAKARAIAKDLAMDVNLPDDFNTGDFKIPTVQIRRKADVEAVGSLSNSPGERHALSALEMVNCFKPWQTCAINELGNVKPCCVYWRSMGNLREGGFETVWNGRKYRALRKSVNTHSDSICYSCRLPQFDAEHGRAAQELKAGMREWMTTLRQSLLTRPQIRYEGVMDPQFDPRVGHGSSQSHEVN
jgi:MoaA/NifB/PqqE/SkfB family radical SAM enzyme